MLFRSNLKFIFNAAERYDSKIFELLLQYKDKMILEVGKDGFEAKIKGAAQGTLQNAYEFRSVELLRQAQKVIKDNIGGDFAKQFEINSNMEFYKKMNDEDSYVKAAKKYAAAAGKDATKLAQLAQIFVKFHIRVDFELFCKIAADIVLDDFLRLTQ